MSKVEFGPFNAIKNARANFKRLPGEAKTTYYVVFGVFCIILYFLVQFFVPKSEADLELPNASSQQRNRAGNSQTQKGAQIPNKLASEIISNRESMRDSSNVVFSRFNEQASKLKSKKEQFAQSLKIDLSETPEFNADVPDKKIELEDVKPDERVEESNETSVAKNDDLFLGVVSDGSSDSQTDNNPRDVVKQLLLSPEINELWFTTLDNSISSSSTSTNVSMGKTVSFSQPENNSNSNLASSIDDGITSDESVIESEEYDGDDFQPGRVILARIDGLIESDTNTPFVRLRPVEGPKEWVEDAIFLAQPELIEGQGYQISVKSVTHKNLTGQFEGVAVTPDEKRSAIIVDDIDSRELERIGYLISGGLLSGLNNLASRVGTTVQNQNSTVTNVEINEETLAISAFGGIGRRGEGYLFDKVAQTPDNYIISQNRLVGIMIVQKPVMNWLPELDNNNVY